MAEENNAMATAREQFEAMADLPDETCDDEYLICPFCGDKIGDCFDFVRGEPAERKCDECGGVYEYWADYSVDYNAKPIRAPENPNG